MPESVSPPTMPRRMRTEVERRGDELRLRCANRQWAGLFLLFWLIGWTVGCVFLAGAVLVQRQLFMVVFAIPFWAAWVFVFSMVMRSFFLVEEFALSSRGITYARRVIVQTTQRRMPLEEIKRVTRFSTVTDSESGATQEGLEVQGTGKPVRLLEGLNGDELRWLEFQLNEVLGALQGKPAATEDPAPAVLPEDLAASSGDDADASLLILGTPALAPPTDSAWAAAEDAAELVFTRRGRLQFASLGGLLFINAFWNGIVSVFVLALFGVDPGGKKNGPQFPGIGFWGLFVFLIPFEAIGLVMLFALVHQLFEPAHRLRWVFGVDSIERRNTWAGIGPRQTWQILSLKRLDLRREDARQANGWQFRSANSPAAVAANYRIIFVTSEGRELCAVGGLTEGEARWMAQAILRRCSRWFH